MNIRRYRLQAAEGADGSTGGTAATLMTDGAQTTPADTSTATPPAEAPADASKEATQQASTDNAAPDAAKTEDAAKTPEKVVPEKYEFKAPEGVTLDSELLGEFEAIAKDMKLSQDEAQKVADVGAKLAQKIQAAQVQAVEQAAAEWAKAASTDKEFGGDKLTENLAVGKKALDAFGTPELRTLLNTSQLGNHPEVIRFFVRAGKAISEDRMVNGGTGQPAAPRSIAEALYPSQS